MGSLTINGRVSAADKEKLALELRALMAKTGMDATASELSSGPVLMGCDRCTVCPCMVSN